MNFAAARWFRVRYVIAEGSRFAQHVSTFAHLLSTDLNDPVAQRTLTACGRPGFPRQDATDTGFAVAGPDDPKCPACTAAQEAAA